MSFRRKLSLIDRGTKTLEEELAERGPWGNGLGGLPCARLLEHIDGYYGRYSSVSANNLATGFFRMGDRPIRFAFRCVANVRFMGSRLSA